MSELAINLNINKICCGCLSEDGTMISIFQESNIIRMFESCTSLQISQDNSLPLQICNKCIVKLNKSYQFQQMCIQSHFTIRAVIDRTEGCNNQHLDFSVDSGDADYSSKELQIEDEKDIESYENECNAPNHETYPCRLCSEKLETYEDLKVHEFFIHVSSGKCSVCNIICSSFADYLNHTCNHKKPKQHRKKFKCKDCDKEYTSSHNLQIHTYSHSGIKPFPCKYCGRAFTTIAALNSHLSLHTGNLPYLCSECGKGFTSSTGLKRHKLAHSGERPFKCTICPGRFAASGDLTVHMRSHTGEKPYLCQNCGKAFSRVSHLNTHTRIHTGEKPYKCSRCEKAFAQSGDLRSHERTHTGEKPYECSVCKKRFIQCSALASHMKTHIGGKSFRCSICCKAFSRGSSLTRHTTKCHIVNAN